MDSKSELCTSIDYGAPWARFSMPSLTVRHMQQSSTHTRRRWIAALGLFFALFGARVAEAQTLGTYTFTGGNSCSTSSVNNTATGVASNVTFSPYTSGSGVTCTILDASYGTGIYNRDGLGTSTEANAIAGNDFNTFSITVAGGYSLTLTQLSFLHRRSTTGATNWFVRSSLDGYASNVATGTSGTSDATASVTLGASFANLTGTVTFRIYAYGASSSTGTWRNDNVSLTGTVAPLAAPNITISEPGPVAVDYSTGTLTVGATTVGSTVCKTLTVTNTGVGSLTINTPTFTGANAAMFSVTGYPSPVPHTIAPSGTATFDVCFTPTSAGSKTATINVPTNVTGRNPFTFTVSGTASLVPGLYFDSPTAGATFRSSYPTTISWQYAGVPDTDPLTIQYAEDGTHYHTIGTTTVGAGSFEWRPDFYHTTWNGTTFANTGRLRLVSGAYTATVSNITVSMQPCVTGTSAMPNQIIAIQDFDNAPANEWNYIINAATSDAEHGERDVLPFSNVLDPTTPLNNTPSGSRAYIMSDKSVTCETDARSMASLDLEFAPIDVSAYTNVRLEVNLASLKTTSTPCGGAGTGMDGDDYLDVYVALNGGSWQHVLEQYGSGNKVWSYTGGTPRTKNPSGLTYTTTTVSGGSTTGKLTVNIPAGVSTVEFSIVMGCNRRDETWAFDDLKLIGDFGGSGEVLALDRDCYLKPTNHASFFPSSTYTGSLAATVGNVANGDTDILLDGSLTVTGNFNLTGNAIVHLPVGTNLDVAGSMTASGGTAFVAAAPHLTEPGSGLVRNVTTGGAVFPVGYYIDNNTGCVKSSGSVTLQAVNGAGGGKFVVRAMATDDANNRPNAAYPYYDNPANRHARSAHTLWHISPQTPTGNENAHLTLAWDGTQVGSSFDPGMAVVGHWNGSQWEQLFFSRTGSSVTADSVQDFSPYMVGNDDQVFPVTLLAFWGAPTADGRAVDLYWRTAGEVNCSHFDIERSTDALTFAPIGSLAGAGTTVQPQNYHHTDVALPANAQTLYYRLRQVDFNGQYTYSNLVEVNLANGGQPVFGLFPNPATGPVTLTLSPSPTSTPTLEVYAATGARLLAQTADLLTLSGSLNNLLPQLAAGTYVVRLVADGQAFAVKLQK